MWSPPHLSLRSAVFGVCRWLNIRGKDKDRLEKTSVNFFSEKTSVSCHVCSCCDTTVSAWQTRFARRTMVLKTYSLPWTNTCSSPRSIHSCTVRCLRTEGPLNIIACTELRSVGEDAGQIPRVEGPQRRGEPPHSSTHESTIIFYGF
jgi:hypothetical protein